MTTSDDLKGQIVVDVVAYGNAVADERSGPLVDTITALEAEVARLQAIIDGLKPALLVGAAVNVPSGNTLQNFQAADELIGPLRVRRSFPTKDTIAKTVAADKAAGYVSFVSIKPPSGVAGTTAGKDDGLFSSIARALPAGTYFTVLHEPENDCSGPEFVAMTKHVYGVVKAANPGVLYGPVSMSYWWGPLLVKIGGAAAWQVPSEFCDFRGVDTYTKDPAPLETDPQFQGWMQAMPDDRPLLIVEYGVGAVPPGTTPDPKMLAKRAQVIEADAKWLRTQPRIQMLLAWHGTGAQGNWALTDPASQAAYRGIAASAA